MKPFEKISKGIRHNSYLKSCDWLWAISRPFYNSAIALAGRNGLERNINGTDRILVDSRLRQVSEVYEPDVWQHLMRNIRPGDMIADVGAFIGLYTVALAKRVGHAGCIYAFEPDSLSAAALLKNVLLNGVKDNVRLINAAVGERNEIVNFMCSGDLESHIVDKQTSNSTTVECVTLDKVLFNKPLDILKIDVEGLEESVIRGAGKLLMDKSRCPRLIYIEVHPYAWEGIGTTSDSLLSLLNDFGYKASAISGEPVEKITEYGEIVAEKV